MKHLSLLCIGFILSIVLLWVGRFNGSLCKDGKSGPMIAGMLFGIGISILVVVLAIFHNT